MWRCVAQPTDRAQKGRKRRRSWLLGHVCDVLDEKVPMQVCRISTHTTPTLRHFHLVFRLENPTSHRHSKDSYPVPAAHPAMVRAVPRQCPVVSLSLSPGGRHAFLLDLEGGVSLFTSPDDKSTAFTPLGTRMTQGLRTTSNTTM